MKARHTETSLCGPSGNGKSKQHHCRHKQLWRQWYPDQPFAQNIRALHATAPEKTSHVPGQVAWAEQNGRVAARNILARTVGFLWFSIVLMAIVSARCSGHCADKLRCSSAPRPGHTHSCARAPRSIKPGPIISKSGRHCARENIASSRVETGPTSGCGPHTSSLPAWALAECRCASFSCHAAGSTPNPAGPEAQAKGRACRGPLRG